jgi:hypothetical protein
LLIEKFGLGAVMVAHRSAATNGLYKKRVVTRYAPFLVSLDLETIGVGITLVSNMLVLIQSFV